MTDQALGSVIVVYDMAPPRRQRQRRADPDLCLRGDLLATPKDSMTLSLGRSTPDAMVDLVAQRIVEALLTYGTLHAHTPGRRRHRHRWTGRSPRNLRRNRGP